MMEILKCVAVGLAKWENHEFQSAYDRSLVYKVFILYVSSVLCCTLYGRVLTGFLHGR